MKGHIDTKVFLFLNIDVIQCVVTFVGVKGLTAFFFKECVYAIFFFPPKDGLFENEIVL